MAVPQTLADALAADTAAGPDGDLGDTPALRLPAELTIYTAAETRAQWLDWLAWLAGPQATGDDTGPCAVDASACGEVDAAGMQLLVSLANSLGRRQRQLQLLLPGQALRVACTDLGLAAWLPAATAPEACA